jgi:hypothetical protein
MFKKSKFMLPTMAAAFSMSILLVPTGAFAQTQLDLCVEAFNDAMGDYIEIEDVNEGSSCVRIQGAVVIERHGDDVIPEAISFTTFAMDKKCRGEREEGTVEFEEFLSGQEFSKWKKYLLNEGCDVVQQGRKVVFVTSEDFTGDLITEAKNHGIKGKIKSSLDAADKMCTKFANDAGLPGEAYTAWLSDSTTDAENRVTQATVPYVLVDGTQVADDFSDLTFCPSSICLDHAINLDENESGVSGGVWTGTNAFGQSSPRHCSNWNQAAGASGGGGLSYEVKTHWTQQFNKPCTTYNRLYCFQD